MHRFLNQIKFSHLIPFTSEILFNKFKKNNNKNIISHALVYTIQHYLIQLKS